MKTIKKIHHSIYESIHGLDTYRALPTHTVEEIDPFLFLAHHGPQVFPPDNRGLPFGPHPHRGFETVTFIIDGDIVHEDTRGFKSQIDAGGIQWMTAGKGLVHSETSSEDFRKNGGSVEAIQIWLNLPSHLKMTKPHYMGVQKDQIPRVLFDRNKVILHPVSGSWFGVDGPVHSMTNIHMSRVEIKNNGQFVLEIDPEDNILFYVVKGDVEVNGISASQHSLVEFDNNGYDLEIKGMGETLLLLGHGKPYHETIVSQGPFVMNSEEEIEEAILDFKSGKMGSLQ